MLATVEWRESLLAAWVTMNKASLAALPTLDNAIHYGQTAVLMKTRTVMKGICDSLQCLEVMSRDSVVCRWHCECLDQGIQVPIFYTCTFTSLEPFYPE